MVKSLPANSGDIRDLGSIPGSGRSPGGGKIPWLPTPVFLPRESPRTEEPGRLQSMESQELDVTEVTARTHGYDTTETVFSQICEISSVPEMVEYASTSMTASSEHFR